MELNKKSLFLPLLLLLFFFNLNINIVHSCDPDTPIVSWFKINNIRIEGKYVGYHKNVVQDVGSLKMDKRSIHLTSGKMVDHCGFVSVTGYFLLCNADKNECRFDSSCLGNKATCRGVFPVFINNIPYYSSSNSSIDIVNTGWFEAGEGYGQLNILVNNLRCDVPGFCRYRFKIIIPHDYTCSSAPNKMRWFIEHKGPVDYPITFEASELITNAAETQRDNSNAYALIGELLIPGDSVYTRIIPVYNGEISTNLIGAWIEDHGLDPSASSCSLSAKITPTGNTFVPAQASECHFTNKKEGPYTIKCGDSSVGICTLVRTDIVGSKIVRDQKVFYLYGIDKVLVKQNLDVPDDNVILLSSLDRVSKDSEGEGGGLHLFVFYQNKYFDLYPTKNVVKNGGTKVIGFKNLKKEFTGDQLKKDGYLLYASGYTSQKFCEEKGYDYVKDFYISGKKLNGTLRAYYPGKGWFYKKDYYYFVKITCSKDIVLTEKVDTYPGTDNRIAYSTHHLQWFDGLGPKIVEIKGDKELIQAIKDGYLTMQGVKYWKINKIENNTAILEFEEEDNSAFYQFVFKEPKKSMVGEGEVLIYPKKYPQLIEEFKLEWAVGVTQDLNGKKVMIARNGDKGNFYVYPPDYDPVATGLGVSSNDKPLAVKNLSIVNSVPISGTNLYYRISSPTDPFFPIQLIPGDKIKIEFALEKKLGNIDQIPINITVKLPSGEKVLEEQRILDIKEGHNEYSLSIVLPNKTLNNHYYYGQKIIVEVVPIVKDNLGIIIPLKKSDLTMEPLKVYFDKVEGNKKIKIILDYNKERLSSIIYTFKVKKEGIRLKKDIKVNLRIIDIEGNPVYSKVYLIKFPEKSGKEKKVTGVYNVPDDVQKDLGLIFEIDLEGNTGNPTVIQYKWIPIDKGLKYMNIGIEALNNYEEFKRIVDNKFPENTIRKSTVYVAYINYILNHLDKDKIKLFKVKITVPSGIPKEVNNIIQNEPHIEKIDDKTLIITLIKEGDTLLNSLEILKKIRNTLIKNNIYWEEEPLILKLNKKEELLTDLI